MGRYLFIILLFGIIASQTACVSNRSYFQNKILVYNSEVSGDFKDFIANYFFIDFYNDSINIVPYPFRLFEKAVSSLDSNLFPYSDLPIKFKKINKTIYVQYSIRGRSFKIKYFKVSNKDSVKASSYDALC